MKDKLISRRELVVASGIAAVSTQLGCSRPTSNAKPTAQGSSDTQEKEALESQTSFSSDTKPPADCEEALSRLMAGNQRFVDGNLRHPHAAGEWRKRLVGGQKPFVTVVGCSDSRVPPELLFDQGFGDLFVIRVAGNVVDTDVTGSIEYGVDHLGTKLVVVMGHEGCGAVTAALQSDEDLQKEPNEIRALVGKIKPAIREFESDTAFKKKLQVSVEDNVRNSVKLLKAVPDLAKAEQEKKTKIIGCVYEIKSGKVRTL